MDIARSYLAQYPGDLVGLATLLGHRSLDTTRLYSELSVSQHATTRLCQRLAQIPTPRQVALLETLLVAPEGERQTPLDRLRRAPTRVSGPALVQVLHRVDKEGSGSLLIGLGHSMAWKEEVCTALAGAI